MPIRFTSDQRNKFADKIMDWGNLLYIALAISESFNGVPLTLTRIGVGTFALAISYATAYWLTRGGENTHG